MRRARKALSCTYSIKTGPSFTLSDGRGRKAALESSLSQSSTHPSRGVSARFGGGGAEAETSLPEYGWSRLSLCFLLSILKETKPILLHHAKREMGGARRLKRTNMFQVDSL